MTTPPIWRYGPVRFGCGTFGGIGGSPELVGRGLDERAAFETLDEAVGLGITQFATAERYAGGASENMIGRWLVERDPAVTGRVRLATKVAPPYVDGPGGRFDAAFLEETFSGSLQRLGVDSVELLLTHAPDDGTPIEETLEGLEEIRASGRCRQLGACNVDAGQLTAALDAAERLGISGFQVVQNSYNLLRPDDERTVRSICAERDLAFTPYSPLAGGALTGKYRRDAVPPPESRMALRPDGVDEMLTPAVHDAIDRLREAAEGRHGVECGTLAASFLTETFNRVRAAGAGGPLTVLADAGFYSGAVAAACRRAGVRFSITAKMTKAIHKAIARIPEDDWVAIPYFLDGADVAETSYRPFGKKSPLVRLIVRRVKPTPGSQLALLLDYDYHAFVTDRDGDTLELEADHRR